MGTDTMRIQANLPIRACNGGLFVSKQKWIHAERVIDSNELILVRDGVVKMWEEDRQFEVGSGQTLLLHAGRRHGGTDFCDGNLQFYWIHFVVTAEESKGLDSVFDVPQVATISRPDRLIELYRRFLDDQESQCLDQVYADLLVTLMLCEVARTQNGDEAVAGTAAVLAQRASAYIRLHYDQPISTASVAKALDCNPDYLGRAFRTSYGTTPTDYIRSIRLRRARTMLIDGETTVAEIARQCGFEDPGYFGRTFRLEEGMSPLAYRRLYARTHVNVL
ncbi:MAG: AraC family transcriptional regulator [Armatimonadota bacterium]|nr:AraC family transcriptional regulator [bacterium]